MIKSMTAYAQASTNTELGELSCELRSLNHRYLDIAPRLPEELRLHEGALRELLSEHLVRGHVDCFIHLKENQNFKLEANIELMGKLHALSIQMQNQVPDMQALRAIDLLRWPGMLQAKQVEPEVMKTHLLTTVSVALDDLIEARVQEGSKMTELIQQRLDGIRKVIAEVKAFLPELAQNYRARLDEKLAGMLDQLDPARIEQEIVIFLQKTDVAEELDRLTVHVEEVAGV